jgi:hypothetical protein
MNRSSRIGARIAAAGLLALVPAGLGSAWADDQGGNSQGDNNGGKIWVTSWTGSAQGPYPSGSAVAQPDLEFAFPNNTANDQTFRLIVHPSLLSSTTRIRFTNVFGSQAVTFDSVRVGLQKSGATLEHGTNQSVHFQGAETLTLQPGQAAWSDPVSLPFVSDDDASLLDWRKLSVSFHVGSTGPMTWHAKAMTTSYVTDPNAGVASDAEDDVAFTTSTTSWYFIDAIDMLAPPDTQVVVALGDSITDGTSTTINGDDRWPDVLFRRLQNALGPHVALVNAGIGGNAIVTPANYDPNNPVSGGPDVLQRLSRDVLSLSGVTAVIWFEGTNDVSANIAAGPIEGGMQTVVQELRAGIPGVRLRRHGGGGGGAYRYQQLHQGQQSVPPRGGFLCADHGPGDRCAEGPIYPKYEHRRCGRSHPSKSGGISGDGERRAAGVAGQAPVAS